MRSWQYGSVHAICVRRTGKTIRVAPTQHPTSKVHGEAQQGLASGRATGRAGASRGNPSKTAVSLPQLLYGPRPSASRPAGGHSSTWDSAQPPGNWAPLGGSPTRWRVPTTPPVPPRSGASQVQSVRHPRQGRARARPPRALIGQGRKVRGTMVVGRTTRTTADTRTAPPRLAGSPLYPAPLVLVPPVGVGACPATQKSGHPNPAQQGLYLSQAEASGGFGAPQSPPVSSSSGSGRAGGGETVAVHAVACCWPALRSPSAAPNSSCLT